jgi:hypothetical protein
VRTEEALDALDELGFHVLDTNGIRRVGWDIKPVGEAWGVFELYETTAGERAQGALWAEGTAERAASWLATYLRDCAGAP